jgi:CDP-diacylglycerol--serine O-phosphatidyltransferase
MNVPRANDFPNRANHRLRRGVYLLPSFFTVGNLLFGYYAILATLRGGVQDFDNAALAIGLAILFDALDGRVARATGTTSEFGKQFDSLADVVSFGIAPAFLAFAWGFRGMVENHSGYAQNVYKLSLVVTFGFVLCAAWRLARFNIHGMAPGTESRYFVGMPTPAAAGMIAAVVHAVKWPLSDWLYSLLWLAMVASLAVLMASTIRYYGFKDIGWRRRQRSLVVVMIGLLIWLIIAYREQMLLLIASAYALSGLTTAIVRAVRHRFVSHPA